MESDVEVLREIEAFVSAVLGAKACDPDRAEAWRRALSSAISALEARETQPKVEGRMEDADFNRDAAATCDLSDLHASLIDEARRARASEAALSERVAALTAQNAYLRQTLEDVREWAGPKHVMVFDDGDVAVSDYVQTALDFKGVQIPAAPRPEFKP